MLRAIAVYERNIDGNFVRQNCVHIDNFLNRDIRYFEAKSLPELQTREDLLDGETLYKDVSKPQTGLGVLFGSNEIQYYYAQFIPETNHLLLLISKKELDELEFRRLLINADHVDQGRVKFTFLSMLSNPIGYTDKDKLPGEKKEQVRKLKIVALNAKAAATERGERIARVEDESDHLFEKSGTFKVDAQDIEKSYTCCGGWMRNPLK